MVGETVQFTVHLWHETVERISVASTPGPEQLCNVCLPEWTWNPPLSQRLIRGEQARGTCKTLPRVTPSENSAYAAFTIGKLTAALAATNLGRQILMITINQSFCLFHCPDLEFYLNSEF